MFTDTLPTTIRRGLVLAAALAVALPGIASARSLEEAKAAGTIVVGIQGDNSPWGFIDSSGIQQGLDADMAAAFAKSLGVEVTFQPLAVANRIPALQTGKVDILFATMGMTAERAKTIQYSQPYAANQLSVVAPKDMKITDAADLSGKTIGVPRSSAMDTSLTALAPSDATLLRFDDDAANIQALLSGQVEAVGANQFYLQRLEAASPGTYENKIPLVTLYNGAGSRLGEADWNAALNTFLTDFIKTDDYKAIYDKWLKLTPPEYPAEIADIPFTVVTN